MELALLWVSGEMPTMPWGTEQGVPQLKGSLAEALGYKRVGQSSPSLELKQLPHISLLQPKSDAILIWIICAKGAGVGCNYP